MYIEQIMYGHTIYPYLYVQWDAWYVQLMSSFRVYSYGWMDKMREHCSRRSFVCNNNSIYFWYIFFSHPLFCFSPSKYNAIGHHTNWVKCICCEAFIDLQRPKISRIYDINWSSSLWIRRIKQLQTRIIFSWF